VKKYIQYALRSQGIKQTTITLVGNVAAAGIAAIALILFSKMLGPSLFGEFSVGMSIITILSMFNNGGLNTAILKLVGSSTNKNTKNLYFSITLRYRLLFSAVILIAMTLLTPLLAQWLKMAHPSIIILSLIFGFSTTYFEHLVVMLHSTYRFTEAVYANILQAFVKLMGGLLLFGIHSKDVVAAFALYSVAPYLALPFYKQFLPSWVQISISNVSKKAQAEVLSITKHAALATISTGILDSVGVLFVQSYMSSFETGLYGGAQRIALLFTLIAASLGDVLFARVAQYKLRNDLNAYMKKAVILALFSLLSFTLVFPFSRFLLLGTIGSEYLLGLPILNVLLASVFIHIATIPFIALFYSYDSDWYFSSTGLAQLIFTIVGNMLFVPMYGLMAAAAVRLVVRMAIFVFTVGISMHIYRKKMQTLRN
jgi:O-antigen/teichoic acid export membrane protein